MEKTYSHSPLTLPGSLNLKAGFSFGYREPFRELERSPGPVYHLDHVQEEKRTDKVYTPDYAANTRTAGSASERRTTSTSGMRTSRGRAPSTPTPC
jgi:hypothetical protein